MNSIFYKLKEKINERFKYFYSFFYLIKLLERNFIHM